MPQIIPIKNLKNTSEISELCHQSDEPIFVTKNGYGDMVIMSIETYEKSMFLSQAYQAIEVAEQEMAEGKIMDAKDALKNLRSKYGI
jgi:PHD/YefM family antitoxin component YafN of YafNO toxin-antitoxin module